MPPITLMNIASAVPKRKFREYILKFHAVEFSDRGFLKAAGYKTIEEVLNSNLPRFFFSLRDKDKIIATVREEYPGTIRETINGADEICEHVFDLLGSGKVKLGTEIDWHLDFKSGFRWDPRTYYLGTRKHVDCYLKKGIHADVKVPWELSRCQHFAPLGKAYWFTRDEKYAKEFAYEVGDWIEKNPVELGVNWACTMDVAIRAVNWLWGYYYFFDSSSLTEKFRIKFLKSLFLHGRHIRNHLEFGLIRGNHYLSDIVALIYLGLLFQESQEGRSWLEKGRAALEEEMEFQIYSDGVDFEGSISYHRFVTELFLSATLLCLKNGITFPEWYMQKLERMIEFIMYYTKPDGAAPQIGDNDDGRLHILADYGSWNRLDHRYLLSIGAVLFNRSDFKRASGGFHEEAFWLLGEEGLRKYDELPNQKTIISSKALVNGGFYIMRSDNLYMLVDCIPANPKGPSGHKHNSRLSFELFAYDKSFIIDPGAYIYTADKEMRNLFRSSKYHNTVVVDGEEQNKFDENRLFDMGQDAAVKVNRWEVTKKHDILDAEHSGYQKLGNPVIHRRQIFFDKTEGYWLIKDILSGEGTHQFDIYFHFAPLNIELDSEFPWVVRTKTEGANLAIIPLDTKGLSVRIEKGWLSFQFGVKVEAPIVRYQKEAEAPAEFCWVLYPCKEPVDIKEVRQKIRVEEVLELLR